MGNKIIKNLISYGILLSIFITGDGLFQEPFKFYWYYPLYLFFIVYSLVFYRRIDYRVLITMIALVAFSLLTYTMGLNLVIKQLIAICMSLLVFSFLIIHEQHDLEEIMRKYISVAKVIAVIGFVQVLLYAIGKGNIFLQLFPFLVGKGVSVRLQSITQEPSFIAYTFAPIVFISIHDFFYQRSGLISVKWRVVFIVAYLLTLSTIAYLSLLIMFVVLYFKKLTTLKAAFAGVALAGIAGFAAVLYSYSNDVKLRVDDTFRGLSMDFFANENYTKVNLSTFATLTNLNVTLAEFKDHPVFGYGLGTYEMVYDQYTPRELKSYQFYIMNREDASAIGLRLLAETGLFGLLLFLYFIFRHRIYFKSPVTDKGNIYWLINSGIFVLVVLVFLRNGNYTVHGKMLFFLMFFYSWLEYRRDKQQLA